MKPGVSPSSNATSSSQGTSLSCVTSQRELLKELVLRRKGLRPAAAALELLVSQNKVFSVSSTGVVRPRNNGFTDGVKRGLGAMAEKLSSEAGVAAAEPCSLGLPLTETAAMDNDKFEIFWP